MIILSSIEKFYFSIEDFVLYNEDGKKIIRPYLATDVSGISDDDLTLDVTTDLYLFYEDGSIDTIFAGFYKYNPNPGHFGGYEIVLNKYPNE